MIDSLQSYLIISSILFSIGLYGIMTRKNAIAILMGIELILNSANLNFIAFNRFNGIVSLDGHVFTIFVIVLAAAEAAVALAIVINLFKHVGSVEVDKANRMKG
jgi:NADH-quinone oxidoreductase subunit K